MRGESEIFKSDHEAFDLIYDIALELANISGHFDAIGNSKVAKQLYQLSGELMDAKSTLKDNKSDLLSLKLKEARESSTSILEAALASCTPNMAAAQT